MTRTTLARRVLLYCDAQCIGKMNSPNTITERRFCWLRCVDLFERQNFSLAFFFFFCRRPRTPTIWFGCTMAFIQTPCTRKVNNRTSFILESVTDAISLTGIDTKSRRCIKYCIPVVRKHEENNCLAVSQLCYAPRPCRG